MLARLALAMALGIALADLGDAAPAAAIWPLAAGAALALALRSGAWAVAGLAAAAGWHAHALQLTDAREAARRPPEEVRVEGTVARRSAAWQPRWVDLEAVRGAGLRRVRVYAASAADLDDWLPGERVRAQLRVAPLLRARNPGDTDSLRRLWREGLGAGATLAHPSLAVVRGAAPGLRASFHAERRRIARSLAAGGPGSGLVRGLALGERGALAPAQRDVFVRLGLAHVLAVSGLHLAWVAAAVYALARGGLRRSAFLAARCDTRRLAFGLALSAAVAYAALAGGAVPVRRSLVLLAAAALAIVRFRPQRPGAPLAAAALWILAREPAALFAAGAQLSFSAVAALTWAAPAGESTRTGVGCAALRRSATAILATAPLIAWHGGGVPLVALAANLVALPWLAAVVLPSALVAAVASAAHLPGALLAAKTAAALAHASVLALGAVASALPGVERAPPSRAWLCAVVGLAVAGVALRATAGRAGAAVAIAALLAIVPPAPVAPAPPRLVALDVGQGEAALVQGRRGAVLVDAGGAYGAGDAGRRHVVPALRALGVARIDLLVVSHADLDHRGGVPSVLAALPVSELWLPWGGAGDPDFAELMARARSRGVRVREVGRGSPVRRIGDLRVDPLWPPRAEDGSRNARSLVVRVTAPGGARVLLPGDLDADAEARWLARESDPRADVLLLPHHGSRGSSSEGFLDAVAPGLAIASAPCRSRYGMPHPEVRARLAARGIPLRWTGRDGAIRVALSGSPRARGTGDAISCP